MATKRQFKGKRNWTAEEIDLLKKEYPNLSEKGNI